MEKIDYYNLSEWISSRLEPFRASKALLDQYCAQSGEDFGLMDSCVYLSSLTAEQICEVGRAKVPPSCWYTMVMLSDEGSDRFDAGIKLAKDHRKDGAPQSQPLVVKLRGLLEGQKKVVYGAADLLLVSKIAVMYSALDHSQAKVFANMAGYLRKNGTLTPRQIGYLGSLLSQMRSARVMGKTKGEMELLTRLYTMVA